MPRRTLAACAAVVLLALGWALPAAAHLEVAVAVQCCSDGNAAKTGSFRLTITVSDLNPGGSAASPNVFAVPYAITLADAAGNTLAICGTVGGSGTVTTGRSSVGAMGACSPAAPNVFAVDTIMGLGLLPAGFVVASGSPGTTNIGVRFTLTGALPAGFDAKTAQLVPSPGVAIPAGYTAFPVVEPEDGAVHVPESPAFALLADSAHNFVYSSVPNQVGDNLAVDEPETTPVAAGCAKCAGATRNAARFDATPIAAGNWVWFSARLTGASVPAAGATAWLTDQAIIFTDAAGTGYSLAPPSAEIVFAPDLPQLRCTAGFVNGTWITATTPDAAAGRFIGGFAWQVPPGFAGTVSSDVDWRGTFASDSGTLRGGWRWGAAVYTQLPTMPDGTPDYAAILPKGQPQGCSIGNNSDRAGTPEGSVAGQPIKNFLISGGRGAGGSDFTGAPSGARLIGCVGVCRFHP